MLIFFLQTDHDLLSLLNCAFHWLYRPSTKNGLKRVPKSVVALTPNLIQQFTMLVTSFVHKNEITLGFKQWSTYEMQPLTTIEHWFACMFDIGQDQRIKSISFPAVLNVFWSINPPCFLAVLIMSTVKYWHELWVLYFDEQIHGYKFRGKCQVRGVS